MFVLGRCIYQTACGGSTHAQTWINNIDMNLSKIGGNASIHLLNGILFEIYFNSKGELRQKPKTNYYERPIMLCLKEEYASCSTFIRYALEQYPQRIIYLPGSPDSLIVDILISQSNGVYHIDGVFIDGLNCMYNEDASRFYAYDATNWYVCEMDLSEITSGLLHKIVVPKNKVKFTYNLEIPKNTKIIVPVDYNLLRYI